MNTIGTTIGKILRNGFALKRLGRLVQTPYDKGKNPSQKRETLPVPQVPIRLTNVWYSRIDGIMDPLPSKFGWL